jgi:membrane protease YdiL (CAAX protease family)
MAGQSREPKETPERNPGDFILYYRRELTALSNPATPLFAALVYCFTLLIAYYFRQHAYQLPDEIRWLDSFTKRESFIVLYGIEGAWYLVGPSLATIILLTVTSISSKVKSFFPLIGFRNFGLRIGTVSGWRDALVFFAIILPFILVAGLRQDFSGYYPLSELARSGIQWFIAWQAVQFLFFLGWEFLNRGLLLFGFESSMGRWSVIAAAVPFCLLHFGKPGAEAVGSFCAALALGWLTLRARSIMPAVALHWACAFMLDVIVITNNGGFSPQ